MRASAPVFSGLELGAELARRREMSQQEIDRFLPRTAESDIATNEPAPAACAATAAPVATGSTNDAT